MKEWDDIEAAAAELWCRALWCQNKARTLKWVVCNEARNKYERGNREPSVVRATKDYHSLSQFRNGRRGRKGRATWFCMAHSLEEEELGGLRCIVEDCVRLVGRETVTGMCSPHQQQYVKHGTTEYMSKKLPLAPALAEVSRRGGLFELCADTTTRERWQKVLHERGREGIPMFIADKFAVELLGSHPALVWGDEWWDKTAI